MANPSKKSSDRNKSNVASNIDDLLKQNSAIKDWSEVPEDFLSRKPLISSVKKTIKEVEKKILSVPNTASALTSHRGYSPSTSNRARILLLCRRIKSARWIFSLRPLSMIFRSHSTHLYFFGGANDVRDIYKCTNDEGFSGDCFIEVKSRESLFHTLKKDHASFHNRKISVGVADPETGKCYKTENYPPGSASSDVRKNPPVSSQLSNFATPGSQPEWSTRVYKATFMNRNWNTGHHIDDKKPRNTSNNTKHSSGA
uniref:Uncharacterized protein n=1 Tax=Ditylenchus dipsaci TaxID=166011 RepID=A0A915DBU0_9BILA